MSTSNSFGHKTRRRKARVERMRLKDWAKDVERRLKDLERNGYVVLHRPTI